MISFFKLNPPVLLFMTNLSWGCKMGWGREERSLFVLRVETWPYTPTPRALIIKERERF